MHHLEMLESVGVNLMTGTLICVILTCSSVLWNDWKNMLMPNMFIAGKCVTFCWCALNAMYPVCDASQCQSSVRLVSFHI